MSKLLSAEIHAVYWSPLTARAWRILNWLRAEKAPRSRYAIAETVKIPPSALTALTPMLIEQGFVREVPRKEANSTYAPLLGLTKKGRIAGKKRLPHSLVAAVAPMTAELTSSVAITTRARALLLYLRDQLMAGKIPPLKEIAAELRTGKPKVLKAYERLVLAGLALPFGDSVRGLARMRITSLGLAAACGAVRIETVADPDAVRAETKRAERQRKQIPSVAVEPLPAPVVTLPEKFQNLGGIKHPPPPPAYGRHGNMSSDYYRGLTTVPSMARTLGA